MTKTNRRQFVKQTVAGSIAAGYFISTAPVAESKSPNERLNIAAVGVHNRARGNLDGVASQNIVCMADIDRNFLAQGKKRYKAERVYSDYRVMLEKEAEKIDAVVVSTPDHSHAPASAMAMRLKKHVYCEKPLAHTVFEARTLKELAKKNNLVTQMGTQIHAGNNYRRVVELVQGGAIGPVKEVHVWAGARYTGGVFTTNTDAPKNVNWDLFLGPAVERPYSEKVHPFNWRRFWDYGTGSLGDFGCHYMDLPHWALKLRNPLSVEAKGPKFEPVSTPPWLICKYQYPARGKMPPVKLTWYDSGQKPALLAKLRDANGKPFGWGSGVIFVGSGGRMLLANYGSHHLLPTKEFADFKRPEPTIPNSIGHHAEWLKAIKTKGKTTCNFDYSGSLSESVLLGTVAYRSGEKIMWDAKTANVTNSEKAQGWVHKEYRKGWTL